MSGYQWCACRDCFEPLVGGDEPELCSDCREAGCEIGNGDCQRDDAYTTECEQVGHIVSLVVDECARCGLAESAWPRPGGAGHDPQ